MIRGLLRFAVLCSLLYGLYLFAVDAPADKTPITGPTDTVLERVVPRACLLSVQLKDPTQCHIVAIELNASSECRGPVGGSLSCSSFNIKLDGPGCAFTVTKRSECENVNVKKVLRNEQQ